MIKTVDEKKIDIAARIHSESWQESHKSFCNPEFVAKHTQERQKEYLLEKIKNGIVVYMLRMIEYLWNRAYLRYE